MPDQEHRGPPAAPPTEPGPVGNAAPSPSAWPTVLGVIAIVFGVLGTLGGAWGALVPLFPRFLGPRAVTSSPAFESLHAMESWYPLTVALALLALALALLLLAGGVGLLRQRRWGVATCRAWAGLKIVLVAITTAVTFAMQQRVVLPAVQAQATATGPAPSGAIFTATLYAGAGFSLMWGWALPVFVLIWFGRRRVREEVAAWKSER